MRWWSEGTSNGSELPYAALYDKLTSPPLAPRPFAHRSSLVEGGDNPESDVDANAHNTKNIDGDDADTMDSMASTASFKNALSSALDIEGGGTSRILSFKDKAPAPKGDTVNNLKVLYSQSCESSRSLAAGAKMVSRHIPSAPSRILDAPDLLDDYYLNLLHWSDKNILAVALSQTVYLWNAGSGDIQELCTLDDGESEVRMKRSRMERSDSSISPTSITNKPSTRRFVPRTLPPSELHLLSQVGPGGWPAPGHRNIHREDSIVGRIGPEAAPFHGRSLREDLLPLLEQAHPQL